jgi:SAM-dependent methyltransferase
LAMKRELTNQIRFIIEDCLPPILRDSSAFRALARSFWGKHIDDLAEFRRRAAELTPAEYEALYRAHPRIHLETDNSAACVEKVTADVIGDSVCDVGCGTGYLVNSIKRARGGSMKRYVGVDFVKPAADTDGFEFVEASIEALPFADREFDTVVCTHVIEHILDYSKAVFELRRIAGRRLIIVVPREREAIYTFNPHFNFFPYKHSFLRAMIPLPGKYSCRDIGRDIYYCEDRMEAE